MVWRNNLTSPLFLSSDLPRVTTIGQTLLKEQWTREPGKYSLQGSATLLIGQSRREHKIDIRMTGTILQIIASY